MEYTVEYSKSALKELKKFDKSTRTMILSWISKNLVGCNNPYAHGKALIANHAGKWRYRVGDYRIVSEIQEDKIVILVLNIGHRREIY